MSTTTRLKEIQLEEQIKLSVSQQIFDKIRYLCKCIPKVEWSGVLFYKITGSIKDVNNFSIEIIDIFLMDKGTSGYTEYSFDGDVAEFLMNNAMEDPEWMTYKIGHIHSHNTMSVFFSGVDMDELYDNCANHNFYLSLIVNNYMDMIARLVFRGTPKVIDVPYEALDESGEKYSFSIIREKQIDPVPVLFIHECVVQVPHKEVVVEEPFADRVRHIITKADEKAKAAKNNSAQSKIKYEEDDWKKTNGNKSNSRNFNHNGRGSNFPPYGSNNSNVKNLLGTGKGSEDHFQRDFTDNISNLITDDEMFLCFILRMGDRYDQDTLEDALDAVKLSNIEPAMLSATIIDNYGDYYNRFYRDINNITMDDFVDNIQLVVETLDDYVAKYDFLPDLVRELRDFGLKLEQRWKEGLTGESKPEIKQLTN